MTLCTFHPEEHKAAINCAAPIYELRLKVVCPICALCVHACACDCSDCVRAGINADYACTCERCAPVED